MVREVRGLPSTFHDYLTANGETAIKNGSYYLYCDRKWELVGNDPNEAHRALLRKDAQQGARR